MTAVVNQQVRLPIPLAEFLLFDAQPIRLHIK
jgi:hypothetical protein